MLCGALALLAKGHNRRLCQTRFCLWFFIKFKPGLCRCEDKDFDTENIGFSQLDRVTMTQFNQGIRSF